MAMRETREPGSGQDGAGPPPGGRHRWVGVGYSAHPDSSLAGSTAVGQARSGADPRLLLVFCGAQRDPAAVLAGITATAPGIPLVGCSSTTVIGPEGLC